MSDSRFTTDWDLVSVVTERPRWLRRSSWTGHVPFAFWLISVLRPATVVELGTYTGVSFCAFLQALAKLDAPASAVAVDTWTGDPLTGLYGEEVHAALKAHCEQDYGSLAKLLRTTFDDALKEVPDRSVDLLHIDGCHTYEAVRHDYESWRPKLADNAVVLFHDVCVREPDFGVWRLWEELANRHRTLTFDHSFGLGVLAPGPNVPAPLAALLSGAGCAPGREALAAATAFAQAGAALVDVEAMVEARLKQQTPVVVTLAPAAPSRTLANLWRFLTKRPPA